MTEQRLIDKYRPKRFVDVFGQAAIVQELEQFALCPHPCAFIFAGGTGLGKTSMARVLAHELDVYIQADFLLYDSGTLDGEALEDAKRLLRLYPWQPDGWRVVVFEEADMMTSKAEKLMLSLLDDMPYRTVVVFTTNRPEWFEARKALNDRCTMLRFEDRASVVYLDAERLVAEIWSRETGRTDAPTLEALGLANRDTLSMREVVQRVQDHLRPVRFELAAPRPRPASLLGYCGPFGRKHDPAAAAPAMETSAAVAVLDDEPTWVEPIADDEPPAPAAVNVDTTDDGEQSTDTGPAACKAWIATLDPLSTPPSVKSVARRFGISWATASKWLSRHFVPQSTRPAPKPAPAAVNVDTPRPAPRRPAMGTRRPRAARSPRWTCRAR